MILADRVRHGQLDVALAAACEPLSLLFPQLAAYEVRSPEAQAVRLAVLQTLIARCRAARIGAVLDLQAEELVPRALVPASEPELASLEELRLTVERCLDIYERRLRGDRFETPGQALRDALGEPDEPEGGAA